MPRLARGLLALGAVAMAIGVALGAYATHAKSLAHPDGPRLLQAAVLYLLVHGLALVAEGILARLRPSRWLVAAGILHGAGIVLFSGSVALLALSGLSLGVAPAGGAAFIAGWLALAIHALRSE